MQNDLPNAPRQHSTTRRARTFSYFTISPLPITNPHIRTRRNFPNTTKSNSYLNVAKTHSHLTVHKSNQLAKKQRRTNQQKMAYTKDYYSILGLNAPSPGSSSPASTAELRRAYKLALLAAHPDKQTAAPTQARGCTVDEVKEAYTILSHHQSKSDYDNWLLRNPGATVKVQGQVQLQAPSSDFVLGLEALDLSDFDVLDPEYAFSHMPIGVTRSEEESEGQMEWTRACRCGQEKGFRILEEELVDAEGRGEKEVLVGCEGCSLWVRVGFEVEEG